jgi:hypothetical protein
MEQVTFNIKVQGGGQQTVTVAKNANGAALLDAIRASVGATNEDMKVLCAGKRVTIETVVNELRNSPLLVLGVAPQVRSPQANPSLPAVARADGAAAQDERNVADRAIEMENAKLDKLSEAALEFALQNGQNGDYHAEILDQNGKVQKKNKEKRTICLKICFGSVLRCQKATSAI